MSATANFHSRRLSRLFVRSGNRVLGLAATSAAAWICAIAPVMAQQAAAAQPAAASTARATAALNAPAADAQRATVDVAPGKEDAASAPGTATAAAKTGPKRGKSPPAAKKAHKIPDGGRAVPVLPAAPLVPTSAEEKAFFARMDAILAPLYAYAPSDADLTAVRDAVHAVGARNVAQAQEVEARIQDPVARKIVRWFLLRADAAAPKPVEIEEFRRLNPDFPEQGTLRLRAEEALLTRVSEPKEIKAAFERAPPQTGAGLAALAAAHLGEGNRAKAQELAAKAWREHDLSLRTETILLNTLGGLLSEADHKARLDRILMKDSRWAKDRADRAALARRIVPYLSELEQKKANARLAVYLRQKDAARAITALPSDAMDDWGVYFAVVQLNRRAGSDAEDEDAKGESQADDTGRLKEAWRLLLAAPTDPAKIVSPDDWWIERRVSAYAALRTGQPKIAYELVRDPGPLSVNALKDAHMLAGWIALRHLGDVKSAERHFSAMRRAADGPISVSTSEYWLGRVAQASNDRLRGEAHFRNAMPYFDTFYGQLARQTLEPAGTRLRLTLPAEPTQEERQRFLARDAAKAVIVARRAGVESLVRPFLAHLRFHLLTSPGEVALVAHLSHALGDTQWSLRTAKAGLLKGHNLVNYAFPTHAFPSYQPLREPAEPAFLFGIARQESEFNTSTLSGAGARGVLQVMPVTARHICRDYRVRCDIARLSTDAAYNTMIASAYIGDRMSDYDGSYIMTLAGYNAGPGRVRQWVREFGDPRSPEIDPVDWIERIPFEETREYVKKVLANIQVYRARLGQSDKALQLVADLNRARGARPQAASTRAAGTDAAVPAPARP